MCEGMQPGLEPEEVFKHVEGAEPVGAEIHQLHAGLHHVRAIALHHGVDHMVDLSMRLVFGVKDADHIIGGFTVAPVQAVRLVLRAILEGDQAHIVAIPSGGTRRMLNVGNRPVSGSDRFVVVIVANQHQNFLHIIRVIDPVHRHDGIVQHLLFAPSRHEGGEAVQRIIVGFRRATAFHAAFVHPRIRHPVDGEQALRQQNHRQHNDQYGDGYRVLLQQDAAHRLRQGVQRAGQNIRQ